MTSHWFVILSYLFVKYFSIYCNEIEDGIPLSFQNPEPIWAPNGPQGPPGAMLKYDLLSNSQPSINYPNEHIGAFVPQKWPAGFVNNELQEYVPEAAFQDTVLLQIVAFVKC